MVLTSAQPAAFFHEEAQMGIPNHAIAQVQAEGLTNVHDFADFDKEYLQQLADNLRKPGGRVPYPNPNAAPGAHPLVRITSYVALSLVENEGKVALIHRALYGGKSAGRDFRNHLRSCMHHIGFKSCPADPDVWMRPAIKSDGTNVYEYVLLYTDDSLSIGIEAESSR